MVVGPFGVSVGLHGAEMNRYGAGEAAMGRVLGRGAGLVSRWAWRVPRVGGALIAGGVVWWRGRGL